MLSSDGNQRQASVGDDSLLLPPDHRRQDNARARQSWATASSTSDPSGVRFREDALQGGQEGSFRRNNRGKYSVGQNVVDHSQFDGLSNDGSATAMGAMATFRTAAMARHWVNKSRRQVLKEKQSVRNSTRVSETTPLRSLDPEGGGDGSSTRRGPQYDTVEAIKSIIMGKAVSVLLLLIPFAIWSHYGGWGAEYVFWLNFCVMIPLASILGDFTEEAALHTNDTVGGLLNATFGNAVEVVVAIQALLANEIRVVQATMIGSIFSNLLLVLGCCFFFGGLYYKELVFNSTAATANMGLLALSSIAMVLPTPFAAYYNIQDEHVLIISRFSAVFLLFMYIQLLIFQLHTHKDMFDEIEEPASNRPQTNGVLDEVEEDNNDDGEADGIEVVDDDDDDDEQPSISMAVALIGLGITTLSVTFFSDFLVGSIDEFCKSSGISRTFVGLIILPIVGNAVEHITAVTVAMKNKMDLSMGVAVGSCTQISLFVVPLIVLVGWATDKPMTLNFPHFEITLYILSVFTVSVCLSNPRGNWLEGSLLITTYIMIAIGFWFEKVVDFR